MDSELLEEAAHLHACFFRIPLDAVIAKRYVAAHRLVFGEDRSPSCVRTVIQKKLDAEAVELTFRRRKRFEFSQRIQILFYILEVRAAYFSYFVLTQPSRSHVVGQLLWAAIRSGWKLLKGEFLVRRYGLL